MTPPAYVRVTIHVDVDPDTAFAVFTEEIDAWYQRGPHNFADPARAVGIRFEPFVGGRLIEVHDRETGEGLTMARIDVWEPGKRLVFVDNRETEADVTFEASDGGTRVTLEHRGLERLAPHEAEQHARFGWRLVFGWYEQYATALQPE
jgi:Activator of Hsp90 ATPase homolog 1-like protein